MGSPGEGQLIVVPIGVPLTGHVGPVEAVAFGTIEDRSIAVTGGWDGTVRVWDLIDRTAIGGPLTGHTSAVVAVAFGTIEDRPIAVTGGDDNTVRVWDLIDRTAIGGPLTGHTSRVVAVAFGTIEDRPIALTGSWDGTVRVWDLINRNAIGGPLILRVWDLIDRTAIGTPLTGHPGLVSAVAFGTIEDRPIAVAGAGDGVGDGTVRVCDLINRTAIGATLTGHPGLVSAVAFGTIEDRPIVVTGSEDGAVWVCDLINRTPIGGPLTGHTGLVSAVAFGTIEDRPIAVTGSWDGTVRMWDLINRTAIGAPMTGHTGPIEAVAFGTIEDRPIFVSGGRDGTVRVWEVVRELPPVERVSGYVSDAASGRDLLDRSREAVALADVITARSAQPPLAVGVFGQWGEGKSQFLDLLQAAVAQRTAAAGSTDPIAHGAVRQVRFNAWHYAEADLWASLVAELFAQMSRTAADPGVEARQRSRLTSDLIESRGIRQELAGAEDRLKALQAARQPRRAHRVRLPAEALPDAGITPLVDVQERYRQWLGLAGAARRWVGVSAAALGAIPRRWWVPTTVAVMITTAVLVWGPELLLWQVRLRAWLPTIPGAAALFALVAALRQGWQSSAPARLRISQAWARAQAWHADQEQRLDLAIAVAEKEVTTLRGQLQNLTAAGQLAGLVQDRDSSSDYRQRLGLMTQIRQDFDRMAELLLAASQPTSSVPEVDAAGDRLPAIDRIVLYIDDLDRCPPGRVVEVLEAVHLLLAGRLFVVVVAVDPRWLLKSITSHYHDLFTADPATVDETWASGPAQYLEKIFQVVLTLPPLERAGYRAMIHNLVGLRADDAQGHPQDQYSQNAPTNSKSHESRSASPAQPPRPAASAGIRPNTPRTVERVDPLALTADEYTFMTLLGPPLITSPRAVKRLTNSYGLLAALRHSPLDPERRADLQQVPDLDPAQPAYPYRAAMTLLAVVLGFPELGPTLFTDIHRAAHTDARMRWKDYRTRLRHDGLGHHPVQGTIPPPQMNRWNDLSTALDTLHWNAQDAGLALPQRLDIWAAWVIPVGRLSFPTGPAVTSLATDPNVHPRE
jgi:WD40 repeat protein